MRLPQALSYRRQLIRKQNMKQNYRNAGPGGSDQGAGEYAREFEASVGKALIDLCPRLKEIMIPETNQNSQNTPDFLFTSPIQINGNPVNWIEVKTYYGCGSLTSRKLPIGKVPAQAARYSDAHGPGAVLFGQGFHESLANRLKQTNVICLDSTFMTMQKIEKKFP